MYFALGSANHVAGPWNRNRAPRGHSLKGKLAAELCLSTSCSLVFAWTFSSSFWVYAGGHVSSKFVSFSEQCQHERPQTLHPSDQPWREKLEQGAAWAEVTWPLSPGQLGGEASGAILFHPTSWRWMCIYSSPEPGAGCTAVTLSSAQEPHTLRARW